LDSDDDWHFALADKPWSEETMRTKTLEYMSLKIEADDCDLQQEGTHAMWEFATNKAHHETFTHEVRHGVGRGGFWLGSSKRCAAP
jgi:lipopolysaccharide biosynthesis glycosyltransferase